MSDSDDTDVLLLIPPDYFAEHGLEEHFKRQQALQRQATEVLNATISHILDSQNADDMVGVTEGCAETAADNMPPPTAAYQFLAPSHKAELNHINSRLCQLESNNRHEGGQHQHHQEHQHQEHQHQHHHDFDVPSDISTISTNTVRTQMGHRRQHLPQHNNNNGQHQQDVYVQQHQQQQQAQLKPRNGLIHSTPKQPAYGPQDRIVGSGGNGNAGQPYRNECLLLEIDHYLEQGGVPYEDGHHNWKDYDYPKASRCDSLPAMDRLSLESMPQMSGEHGKSPVEARNGGPPTSNLISLSEIWGKSGGQATAIMAQSTSLKEEHLRRQHLEKTVHQLQSRLLEYQQRLSVAIEVDRSKDAALAKAQLESKGLQTEVLKLQNCVRSLENEQRDQQAKGDLLQKELAQAVSLATKFQEKNEKLEAELSLCSRQTNECNNMYKQQVDDLEVKLHASKRAEDFANNELTRTKDRLVKAEYQADKLKVRNEELEKECSTLRHQKEMLQEFHQKQKSRAEALETQKKSLHESLSRLTDTELTLKKKLELQQKTLKAHYQQQLEHVVAQKMKEFQEQLDKSEEHLKAEARDRERLIAERAVRQLELINEKNEIELNLLQEKHGEEVALYRIQLANASKRINDVELKLDCYKSKRADIAEKLHDVMEKQWQQALEILTSPNQSNRLPQTDDEGSPASPDCNTDHNRAFEGGSPKSSKTNRCLKENNLNVCGGGGGGKCANGEDSGVPFDRLQAYIELLLSKSPSDFEKLNQILALSGKTKSGKLDRSTTMKRFNNGKPPWKS